MRFFYCLSSLLLFFYSASAKILSGELNDKNKKILFTENKGQFYDQDFKANNALVFAGSTEGLNFFLKNNGVSYQFQHIKSWKKSPSTPHYNPIKNELYNKTPDAVAFCRLDVSWINANAVKPSGANAAGGLNNYYFSHCPEGITGVQSYEDVYYKNIYNNIDLHYYSVHGRLKYDYIVAPNADHTQIRFKIEGASKTYLRADGSLVIVTPLGNLIEDKPVVFQEGRILQSNWILKNNELSFDVKGRDLSKEMIIDPAVRNWATFYGTSTFDLSFDCVSDSSGNVFMSGYSGATGLGTSGVYQSTLSAGTSAYLVKFDVNGNRQWCTYYTDGGITEGRTCGVDLAGNVYLAGVTNCASGVATNGTNQTTLTGTYDAFVVKFTSAGLRTWGTYYGGTGYETVRRVTAVNGDVYFSGETDSPTSTLVATPGAFQTASSGNSDGFLGMLNNNGQRVWSTYIGTTGWDIIYDHEADASGNVYFIGDVGTSTGTVIASAGSYQSTYGGSVLDACLGKFSNTGQRIFCTYYGGSAIDHGVGLALTNTGDVLITGQGLGSSIFASSGAYQTSGRNINAKFSSTGSRIWGSFYGPPLGDDTPTSCTTDKYGNMFLAGLGGTAASTLIATPGNHQTTFNGGTYDAWFMKFTGSGFYTWGTYYGSANYEQGNAIAVDNAGHVYGCVGSYYSNSNSYLATAGAFQTTDAGGSGEGLLVQFEDCQAPAFPVITSPTTALAICSGASTTLTATGSSSLSWYANATTTNAIVSGSTLVTPTLAAGSYSYFVEAKTCSASRTMVIVAVQPKPIITVISGSVCPGTIFTINPAGASTYSYSTGQSTVLAVNTITYSVSGSSSFGCLSATPATGTLHVFPSVSLAVNSGSICAGQVFTISATGANSYSYSTITPTISPNASLSFSVIGESMEGCLSSTPAIGTLSVYPLPTISVNSGSVCAGKTFSILAGGANTYTYSTIQNTFVPLGLTNYQVWGSNQYGCDALVPATGTVIVYPSPTISINSGTVCSGSTFTLVPSGGSVYTLSVGQYTLAPANTTTYSVIGESSQGCIAAAPASGTLTVFPSPLVTVNSGTICEGENFIIVPGGATSYTSSVGGFTLTPSFTQTYSVKGESNAGCISLTDAVGKITLSKCLSMTESENADFTIFPNPNTGKFEIVGVKNQTLILYNALGQQLKEIEVFSSGRTEVFDLAAGVYYIIGRNWTKKIVVSR